MRWLAVREVRRPPPLPPWCGLAVLVVAVLLGARTTAMAERPVKRGSTPREDQVTPWSLELLTVRLFRLASCREQSSG